MKQVVLIAEDDQDIINVLCLYLENEGFQVITVDNGKTVLEYIQNQKIDLAIFDIMMPQIDGYTLVKEVRKFSHLPIIVLSAKNQDSDKILGLNIGVDDY